MSEDLLVHEFGMIVALHFGRPLPDLKNIFSVSLLMLQTYAYWLTKKADFSKQMPMQNIHTVLPDIWPAGILHCYQVKILTLKKGSLGIFYYIVDTLVTKLHFCIFSTEGQDRHGY